MLPPEGGWFETGVKVIAIDIKRQPETPFF
jgi:hypothetical protein